MTEEHDIKVDITQEGKDKSKIYKIVLKTCLKTQVYKKTDSLPYFLYFVCRGIFSLHVRLNNCPP